MSARIERRLIGDYEALLEEIVATLTPQNHAVAVGLANMPKKIRGFGHIKARNLEAAKAEEAELLARFRAPSPALADRGGVELPRAVVAALAVA